jgi:hypothetical protein
MHVRVEKIFCNAFTTCAIKKSLLRSDPRPMKSQRPISSDEEHRVLQFRPRTSPSPTVHRGNGTVQPLRGAPKPLDLSRYEQPRTEPDDFRHRMLANIAALAFTIALTAIGIWLAVSIADLRRTQDCVLMGRRDCAKITTPHI